MKSRTSADDLRVGFAQLAPVWLDREATLAKVVAAVHQAADEGADVVGFGECLVPLLARTQRQPRASELD